MIWFAQPCGLRLRRSVKEHFVCTHSYVILIRTRLLSLDKKLVCCLRSNQPIHIDIDAARLSCRLKKLILILGHTSILTGGNSKRRIQTACLPKRAKHLLECRYLHLCLHARMQICILCDKSVRFAVREALYRSAFRHFILSPIS